MPKSVAVCKFVISIVLTMAAAIRMKPDGDKLQMMILIIIATLILGALSSDAQVSIENGNTIDHEPVNTVYKGFETSFGVKSFTIHSNIKPLQNMSVIEEGGRAGALWGNKVLRSRIGAGFYYSACSVPNTVDLFESDASVNFYPFGLFSIHHLLQPYITGGLSYGIYKFSGAYLDNELASSNLSYGEQRPLGNVQ